MARLAVGDAAGTQIKQRRLVEIADAGAMGAFDIVGVNLEFGLGVDHGAAAEQQVSAQLMRIGLLRMLVHDDAALEGAMAAAGGDALDQFAGLPARRGVLDRGDDIGFTSFAGDDVGAVDLATRALAGEAHIRLTCRTSGRCRASTRIH